MKWDAGGMPTDQPSITFHEAYRFEIPTPTGLLRGTVTKVLPRRKTWEASVDGTAIRTTAETRREAVLAAYAEAARR